MNFFKKAREWAERIFLPALLILYLIYAIAYYFFDFELEDYVNLDLIGYFAMAVACAAWLLHLLKRLVKAAPAWKLPSAAALMILAVLFGRFFVYDSYRTAREQGVFLFLEGEFYLNACVLIFILDVCLWVLVKFAEAFEVNRFYQKLDPDNPRNIKKEIEEMVERYEYENDNLGRQDRADRLFEMLRISALSLKRQKKLLRSGFIKNFLLSLLFFVLGLLLPRWIAFLFSLFQ